MNMFGNCLKNHRRLGGESGRDRFVSFVVRAQSGCLVRLMSKVTLLKTQVGGRCGESQLLQSHLFAFRAHQGINL